MAHNSVECATLQYRRLVQAWHAIPEDDRRAQIHAAYTRFTIGENATCPMDFTQEQALKYAKLSESPLCNQLVVVLLGQESNELPIHARWFWLGVHAYLWSERLAAMVAFALNYRA